MRIRTGLDMVEISVCLEPAPDNVSIFDGGHGWPGSRTRAVPASMTPPCWPPKSSLPRCCSPIRSPRPPPSASWAQGTNLRWTLCQLLATNTAITPNGGFAAKSLGRPNSSGRTQPNPSREVASPRLSGGAVPWVHDLFGVMDPISPPCAADVPPNQKQGKIFARLNSEVQWPRIDFLPNLSMRYMISGRMHLPGGPMTG